jgi:hypothetical protein
MHWLFYFISLQNVMSGGEYSVSNQLMYGDYYIPGSMYWCYFVFCLYRMSWVVEISLLVINLWLEIM